MKKLVAGAKGFTKIVNNLFSIIVLSITYLLAVSVTYLIYSLEKILSRKKEGFVSSPNLSSKNIEWESPY